MLVAACASVFALGETLLQPTIPALVNDLAPDHLRGRYNALSSAAFQLAAIIAPPISGALVGHAPRRRLHRLAGGRLAGGRRAARSLRLEPQLPPGVNGVRVPEPERASQHVTQPDDHADDDQRGRACFQ